MKMLVQYFKIVKGGKKLKDLFSHQEAYRVYHSSPIFLEQ